MSLWPKDNQGRITKTFSFKNYRQSFGFVSQIVLLAEKKNHQAQIESIRSIYNYLHPFNINQERYLNFGNFYSCKGSSFINYIVEKISIMDDKILIIDLED